MMIIFITCVCICCYLGSYEPKYEEEWEPYEGERVVVHEEVIVEHHHHDSPDPHYPQYNDRGYVPPYNHPNDRSNDSIEERRDQP